MLQVEDGNSMAAAALLVRCMPDVFPCSPEHKKTSSAQLVHRACEREKMLGHLRLLSVFRLCLFSVDFN